MNNHPVHTSTPPLQRQSQGKWRWTYLIFVAALLLLIVSGLYGAYKANRAHEAEMPRPALETITKALRVFHQQTGRFPKDFRELDGRLWKGAKAQQISADGKSLYSPSGNYYYTLLTVAPTRAGIWAVPVGKRSEEAATHFWYVTPDKIERWMGPALTREQVGVVRSVPSEEQLALLVMTKQPVGDASGHLVSKGLFSLFGF